MSPRTCLTSVLSVIALCAAETFAAATSAPPPGPDDLSLVRPLMAADAEAAAAPRGEAQPTGLLMSGLEKIGVGRPLEDAGIELYGHLEVGYTRNFANPAGRVAFGGQNYLRVFDVNDKLVVMNQLDLNIERRVDPAAKRWDVGGRVELLYGTDAEFIHSSGIGEPFHLNHEPEYQFDPLQFYADVTVPVGNGMRLRFGKFLYFFDIDPNENVFYSHGFAFGTAVLAPAAKQFFNQGLANTVLAGSLNFAPGAFPLTLTGFSAEYLVSEHVTVEQGISVGWNNTLRSSNNDIDVFGRVSIDLSDKTGLTVRAIVGPEQAKDSRNYRFALDVVLSHRFSDRFSLIVNPIFGVQPHAVPLFSSTQTILPGNSGPFNIFRTSEAYWFGVSTVGVFRLDKHVSVALRGEVYRDDGGYTTLFTEWLSEATLGLTIKPFPDDRIGSNFKLRPEIRYDYSSSRPFAGRRDHDQFTFGVDAIFNF